MRTLLIAALSLSALTPSHDADACGSYVPEPRVLRLSNHQVPSFATGGRARSFVVLGTAKPTAKLDWHRVAPSSYDWAEIANDLQRTHAVTFTLLGPQGTRVVSTKQHVFLARTFDFAEATNALEIDNARGFAIALEGVHPKATWRALEHETYRKANVAWVTALGVTPSGSVDVRRIPGTKFEAVSLYEKGSAKRVTFVKHGDENLGRYEGSPLGVFANDGIMQLVLADGARVSTAYLGFGT